MPQHNHEKGKGEKEEEGRKKVGRKDSMAHGHPVKVNAAGIDALQTGLPSQRGNFYLEFENICYNICKRPFFEKGKTL